MSIVLIFFAQYLIYIIALIITSYVILRLSRSEKQQLGIELLISVFIAIILVKTASSLYYNPRPFVEGDFMPLFPHSADNGFPSNHSVAVAIMVSIFWIHNKKLAPILILLSVLVGLGRVLAGVHHIEDISAGFLIAVTSVCIAYQLAKFIRTKLNPSSR